MSETTAQTKAGFLAGLSAIFHSSDQKEAQQKGNTNTTLNSEYTASARELDNAMKSLKLKIEKQRDELSSQTGKTYSAGADETDQSQNTKDLKLKNLHLSISQMQSSILEIQNRLGITRTSDDSKSMEEFLTNISKQLDEEDLDSRIRKAIMQRLQRELSLVSWNVLMGLMEQKGMVWPEPGGIIPGASAEDKANATAYRLSEAGSTFLGQNLENSIKGMRGVVSAWKSYPDLSSWLWQEVALRGAGCYIRCYLLKAAVEKLQADKDTIRSTANKMLEENISKINSLLQAGVRSLEDAEKVAKGADLVVQNFIPDLAWEHAKPVVDNKVSELMALSSR
jgi:hypothetical protein